MSKRILIIDDSEDDRELMATYIQEFGFDEIISANSGEKGILSAEEHRPDIIILDTNLPGMDGFEVCQRIKSVNGLNSKVIMLTGLIDAIDATKARQMGADDYCAKTHDCAPLLQAIKAFLS